MPETSDRFKLLEGLQLPDRYAIRRPIATGGMASVWCARDRMLGRSVAIKLIAERFARDESALERFKREARAAARLSSHRHVVTIYDIGQAADRHAPLGRPFIVMEFLSGGTVADALRVGAVTRDQAVEWIAQAAAALDYAHARGVIHRDIKPGNLLLDGERVLHVADFGIAQLASEDTFSGTGQMLGTAAYIAPEQVLGRPATEASDRYALAVAAFELLVGRRPFGAEHFAAQARQHLEEEPPSASRLNPALPAAIDGVLLRGMAKRPEDRWGSAGEFSQAIDASLGTTVSQTTRPSRRAAAAASSQRPRSHPPPRIHDGPARAPRRRKRGAALAALAAVVVGVGVAAADSGMFGSSHPAPTSNHPARNLSAARPRTPVSTRRARVRRRHAAAPRPRPPTTSTVQASPMAATTPPPTADTLQAQGHELLLDGNYSAAIPVIRQALSTASPTSPTYAYALFDLGRALLLSGDPKAAVEVLWQRMQIPNETGVVRVELQQALRALGRVAGAGGAPAQTGAGGAPAQTGPGGAPATRGPGGAPAQTGPGDAPAQGGRPLGPGPHAHGHGHAYGHGGPAPSASA